MSPYRRNIIVGVVVLGALVFLGWMILKFGDRPAKLFATPTFPVAFVAERADGVAEGSPILYRGVGVGRVNTVTRANNMRQVLIDAQIDETPPLPANVRGRIVAQSLLGAGSAISLDLEGPEPTGQLQPGAELVAEFVGLDLLPPQFAELAEELKTTSRELREAGLVQNVNKAVQTIEREVARAGELVESMNRFVGDEKMRADLHAAIADIRAATEKANRIATNVEDFSGDLKDIGEQAKGTLTQAQSTVTKAERQIDSIGKQLGDRLTQVATLLDTFNQITAKINDGKGTAGALVNDQRLYQNLVDTSEQLKLSMADLRRLVEQWEQEGVSMRLSR